MERGAVERAGLCEAQKLPHVPRRFVRQELDHDGTGARIEHRPIGRDSAFTAFNPPVPYSSRFAGSADSGSPAWTIPYFTMR